jgi:hypothetical protein
VGAINQNLIEGKVIMRIPWIGHLSMAMQDWFGTNSLSIVVPILVLLIVLLVIVEFIVLMLKKKPKTYR